MRRRNLSSGIMSISVAAMIISLSILLSSCAATYKIGEKSFDSSEEALKWQSDLFADLVNKITPASNPVGGTAVIFIPSDDEIIRNYITYGRRSGKEGMDYVRTAVRTSMQLNADAIIKRRIFNAGLINRHDGNPANIPVGENDFLIFCDVDGWFIKSKGGARIIPIPIDKNKPEGMERLQSFLDDVGRAADDLRK